MTEATIRRTFQLTDLRHNNNKFWTVEYWLDGTMTTTWGRVGQSSQCKTKNAVAQTEVERLIREKERKGYVEIQLHAPVPAQDSVVNRLPPAVQHLIDLIYREAVTHIEGYLAVDIHTLSQAQLDKGRGLLRQIQGTQQRLFKRASVREQIARWVQDYYNAIPTKLPARIDGDQIVEGFVQHLSEQEERLDQLETGLAIYKAQAQGTSQLAALGGVEISALEQSSHAYGQIADYVDRTSDGRHHIGDIFSVHIPTERAAWECEKRGKHNVVSLFHGTKSWNVRHILKTGLIVPQIATHGRRMGQGIYFADWARRSLNYTGGKISPQRLLFVADVALGTPAQLSGSSPLLTAPPAGYDSVWGTQAFGGLDEFIVYQSSQQTIRALITLE